MAVIPNNARATKRYKLIIEREDGTSDEYQGHTQSIELPTPSQTTTPFGNGNKIVEESNEAVANIAMAQDSENPESLWRLMRENPGQKATLIVYPHYDGTYAESGTITFVRPPLSTNVTNAGPIIHTVACPVDGEFTVYTDPTPEPDPGTGE